VQAAGGVGGLAIELPRNERRCRNYTDTAGEEGCALLCSASHSTIHTTQSPPSHALTLKTRSSSDEFGIVSVDATPARGCPKSGRRATVKKETGITAPNCRKRGVVVQLPCTNHKVLNRKGSQGRLSPFRGIFTTHHLQLKRTAQFLHRAAHQCRSFSNQARFSSPPHPVPNPPTRKRKHTCHSAVSTTGHSHGRDTCFRINYGRAAPQMISSTTVQSLNYFNNWHNSLAAHIDRSLGCTRHFLLPPPLPTFTSQPSQNTHTSRPSSAADDGSIG
jgi:hypothetical protein